jgi:hypothetical protein
MSQKNIEERLQVIEDIIEIDRLEKIYGYYLDNGQMQKIVDCFSDNAESIEIGDRGVFKGKEGIKKFFFGYLGRGGGGGDLQELRPGGMAFHMQHQGVVTVDPDGKTAKGRWYLVMIQSRPIEPGGPNRSILGHGVYENEFVKEDGVWKFKKMFMSLHYRSPIGEGWAEMPNMAIGNAPGRDEEPTFYHPYPNMKMLPFHWKHPVTGK